MRGWGVSVRGSMRSWGRDEGGLTGLVDAIGAIGTMSVVCWRERGCRVRERLSSMSMSRRDPR